MLEDTACPVCASPKSKKVAAVILAPMSVPSELVECTHCRLSYVSPRPSEDEEKKFYEGPYFQSKEEAAWNETRLDFFAKALKRMESYQNPAQKSSTRKLLDVGCGGGFFLNLAHTYGWEVQGLEISKQAAEYARSHFHLAVTQTELSDASLPRDTWDAVTLWNVLDQVRNPKQQLERIFELLRPGGMIVIRVVNLSFHLRLHRLWKFIRGLNLFAPKPEPTVFHLEMFDNRSIRSLLDRCGFEEIKVLNSPWDLKPKALLALVGPDAVGWIRHLFYTLSELLRFLSFNLFVWGPSLLIFARKPES